MTASDKIRAARQTAELAAARARQASAIRSTCERSFPELTFPLGPADSRTEIGCYPIGYLVDDGEYLCAQCVNDVTNPVHMGGEADGWRVEGLEVLEGSEEDYDGPVTCAHCGRVLVSDAA